MNDLRDDAAKAEYNRAVKEMLAALKGLLAHEPHSTALPTIPRGLAVENAIRAVGLAKDAGIG